VFISVIFLSMLSEYRMANILITGAFGNLGMHLTQLLLQHGHHVRCFDLKNPLTEKKATKVKRKVELVWGNLCKSETIPVALENIDYVVHLGAIIPPLSEKNPQLCNSVNVEGTKNILDAIKNAPSHPRLIFTSSVSVFGFTQDKSPPRRVEEPVNPTDYYAKSKVICETLIKESGIPYTILRLGAANPIEINQFDPIMYEIRLRTRIEFVHPQDVATALSNTIDNAEVWGKTFLIGGGPSCQMYYKDYVTRILDVFGVGQLPDDAFGNNPFYTDWLDTTESERVLHYQQHSFESYAQEIGKLMGSKHVFVEIFRNFVRLWLLSKSPYVKSKWNTKSSKVSA